MSVEVLPATGKWDSFAELMLPKKPGARACVCMHYRNSSLDMEGAVAHMRSECATEPGPGVLAFVDGEVAGWCSIAPKSTYRALVNSRTILHVDDAEAWSVMCFTIAPRFRRRGLMHVLLDAAVEHARGAGAVLIEGYPVDTTHGRVDVASGFVGTRALFEAHGFDAIVQTGSSRSTKVRWLMQRVLA